MKVQIVTTVKEFEEVDINYPIYCYDQNDSEGLEWYVKITKDKFYQIKFSRLSIEFNSYDRKPEQISEYWYNKQVEKVHYDNALKEAKEFVSEF